MQERKQSRTLYSSWGHLDRYRTSSSSGHLGSIFRTQRAGQHRTYLVFNTALHSHTAAQTIHTCIKVLCTNKLFCKFPQCMCIFVSKQRTNMFKCSVSPPKNAFVPYTVQCLTVPHIDETAPLWFIQKSFKFQNSKNNIVRKSYVLPFYHRDLFFLYDTFQLLDKNVSYIHFRSKIWLGKCKSVKFLIFRPMKWDCSY